MTIAKRGSRQRGTGMLRWRPPFFGPALSATIGVIAYATGLNQGGPLRRGF